MLAVSPVNMKVSVDGTASLTAAAGRAVVRESAVDRTAVVQFGIDWRTWLTKA